MSRREENLQSKDRYLNLNAVKYSTSEGTGRKPGVYIENNEISFVHKYKEETFLLLYRKGEKQPVCEIPFPVPAILGGTSVIKIKLPAGGGYEYNFRTGDQIITDKYARQIRGREIFGKTAAEGPHDVRGMILQKKYDWKGDVLPALPYEDTVMYQLHIRGYTMQKNSGVRHKGTFRGLLEKIPYLKELGVNQLRLMPAYEFEERIRPVSQEIPGWAKPPMSLQTGNPDVGKMAEIKAAPFSSYGQAENTAAKASENISRNAETYPEKAEPSEQNKEACRVNFWGYTGGYYFAPKASYASDPEQAVSEFKDLVRTCHREKIEIIMEFFFNDEMDFETISDCLKFWAEEYHIDGFAVIARDSVMSELARLPLFADRKLIGTWFSQDTLSHRCNKKEKMLAESNDGFRDDCRRLLKGDNGCLGNFSGRIRQNPADHAVVNYMTHHDGFTMMDLVSYDYKHNEDNGEMGRDGSDHNLSWNCGAEGPTKKKEILQLRLRQRKNAFAMMLLSQGTPMLLAGDEFGNSQNGNNNPYCHDSELTWVDWSQKRFENNRELISFVKELTAFRRKHPILHMSCEPSCTDLRSCGYPDLSFHSSNAWFGAFDPVNCHIGCMYDGRYAGEDCFLYIAYNMHWTPQEFALPQLPPGMGWRRVIDTSEKESFIQDGEQTSYEREKAFKVPSRTVVVLETCRREVCASAKSCVSSDLGEDQRPL